MSTKAELRMEIEELRRVARQMSNICFNLSQDSKLEDGHRKTLRDLYLKYDQIRRREPVK